jgi:hypothetical protein
MLPSNDPAATAGLEKSIALAAVHMTRFGEIAASLMVLGYPDQAAFARALQGTAEEHFLSLLDRRDRLLRRSPSPAEPPSRVNLR